MTARPLGALVARVHNSMRDITSRFRRLGIFSQALGCFGVIGAFLLLNGVLYVGQELYHADKVRAAKSIALTLDEMEGAFAVMEAAFDSLQAQSAYIDALGTRLDNPNEHYRTQAEIRRALAEHGRLVDQWNAGLPALNSEAERYDSLVHHYNEQVEQYNLLAQSAYSRWYLIPVPRGSGRQRTRAPRP